MSMFGQVSELPIKKKHPNLDLTTFFCGDQF